MPGTRIGQEPFHIGQYEYPDDDGDDRGRIVGFCKYDAKHPDRRPATHQFQYGRITHGAAQCHGNEFIGMKYLCAGICKDDRHEIKDCIRGSHQDDVSLIPRNVHSAAGGSNPGNGQESF